MNRNLIHIAIDGINFVLEFGELKYFWCFMFSKSGLLVSLTDTLKQLIKSNSEDDIIYTYKVIEIISNYAEGDKAVKTCLNDKELLKMILSLLQYQPITNSEENMELLKKIHVFIYILLLLYFIVILLFIIVDNI